jgi:hypothetical protein
MTETITALGAYRTKDIYTSVIMPSGPNAVEFFVWNLMLGIWKFINRISG